MSTMSKVRMTKGKYAGIIHLSDERGVIAAAAMDQRGSLKKMIAKARGEGATVVDNDLTEFKTAITKVLTKHSTGILMDPEYGLPALKAKAPKAGVLLAYEKTGYDAGDNNRLPDLLPSWSVLRLVEAGADAIKILMYYNSFDDPKINSIKHAFIERVGAECAGEDAPFFLEIICYDNNMGDEKGPEFAKKKPEQVTRYMEEFSKPQYGVDVLKVEVPVNMDYVEGTRSYKGATVYTKADAMRMFRESASASKRPFIYLSAGVTDDVFRETLELAAEAGTNFSGVLCGRATWQDGVPAYAKGGAPALEAWLEDRGVKNITMLNEVLATGAKPWWSFYGGKDNIEVVG